MTKSVFLSLMLGLTCFFSAAQSKVSYDYDQEYSFATIKTFAFAEEVADAPVNDIVRKQILSAIEAQLLERGFTISDEPDVLVDFNVKVEEKQSESTVTDFYGPRYYRYYWGPSFSTSRVIVSDYLEGTLFVDIIDAKEEQLIWQGRAIGVVVDYKTSEKREKKIAKAMQKVFKRLPSE